MQECFLETVKVYFQQHDSEIHPGLRVYTSSPDVVTVQLRGSRGSLPTYAYAELKPEQLRELGDWIQKYFDQRLYAAAMRPGGAE